MILLAATPPGDRMRTMASAYFGMWPPAGRGSSDGKFRDGKRIKLGFNTDELGIVTSVTDGEAAQASNLLEGDIIGGLSSEGRVNFVNKKSAKVHF